MRFLLKTKHDYTLYKTLILIKKFLNKLRIIWADKNIQRLKKQMAKTKMKKVAKSKMLATIPNISK